ncbi:expressed unknown protein [Ectocarpus siliculosus]|uniref:Uncharacterized protein n=1 Tax=Ectocarpus siliculosus TaxID=2880 RepID=D8LDN1_ECTSI|nr:expressed unknown protein [Ectocarpus siliculosus]|eukprot:CBN78438.1 expressed unknown protein [Ectocarpus siliculosus]
MDPREKQMRQGRRNNAVRSIGHCPVDATRTAASPTPTCSSASMPATAFFSPCSAGLAVGGSARRWTNGGSEAAIAAEKDNIDGVCDDGERSSLAAPTRNSSLRLSKVFCEKDDIYETADDGSSGGLLPEDSAMPGSLAPSSSTSSGARGVIRGDVGNNRCGVHAVAVVTGEEEGEREARSSSCRTKAILSDPPSPVLFRAGNDYDTGAEVLIPPEGPRGVAAVVCPPPRLIRFRITPEGRVLASDAAVVPILRRKRRGRGRQRRVRELDAAPTATASVLSQTLEFDGDGCSSSSGGGAPSRHDEAFFDRLTQRQARGQGDDGGSRTPGGAFKSPAPDANAASHGRWIPPTLARKSCAFEDEESDDDDEMAEQDGGEGKNMDHKRTRSAPDSILPRPHARGGRGFGAYCEALRKDGEHRKTHRPATTVGIGDNSGDSPSHSLALHNGDTTSPRSTVPQPIPRGGATCGGPRSAPSSRRGSGTKRGGKGRGYTAVLGRLKGMLNLESKLRSPPVRRRMSRMEMHKASLIAESFRSPGGSPLHWSSPPGLNGEGFPQDGVLPGAEDPNGQLERPQQMGGRRGGGRSMRAWRARGRRMAGSL